ncbi:MAG: glycosyltransferase family 2 protein [Calditrichaeota bacterium]|nr:MAG: glycosyltransferase family 2 protein [Calditrichota bacterium]
MKSNYIILIPAYNAQNSIEELLARIDSVCPDVQIIVVDDGSTDDTAIVVKNVGSPIYLANKRNLGKGAALIRGIDYIKKYFPDCAAVIFIDSDLQHLPEKIPEFIDAFEKGRGTFILGKREFVLQKMPVARIVSNFITSAIVSLKVKKRIFDSQCGFRLVSLEILKLSAPFQSKKYEFETEILIKAAKNSGNFYHIPIPTIYDNEVSYINGFRDTIAFVRTFFKY